jgi:hypothetical protein
MTIMRSWYEATKATAGHAATAAPASPWPKPWATFAASVAVMPRTRSHRAKPGTGVLRRAESSITIDSLGYKADDSDIFFLCPGQRQSDAWQVCCRWWCDCVGLPRWRRP